MGEKRRGGAMRRILCVNPTGKALSSVAWSPDGTRLAITGDEGIVQILTPDCTKIAKFKTDFTRVFCVTFSPNSRMIAVGGSRNYVQILDSETCSELRRCNGHEGFVFAVAFSPDGNYVTSGGIDKSIRLWDTKTGMEIFRFEGHYDKVWSAIFSPDGNQIVSGSADYDIRRWDAKTGEELARLTGHHGPIQSIAFAPDGNCFASASSDMTIRIWDAKTNGMRSEFTKHKKLVKTVVFSPDGRLLASGSGDQTVRIWDVKTCDQLACMTGHAKLVWSVAFSPDGHRLASAAEDGSLCIWDISDLVHQAPPLPAIAIEDAVANWVTRQCATLGQLANLGVPVTKNLWVPHFAGENDQGLLGVMQLIDPGFRKVGAGIVLSPKRDHLFTGDDNGEIKAWNLISGTSLWRSRPHISPIYDLAISPDGNFLAAGTAHCTTDILDAITGEVLFSFYRYAPIVSVAFSPDSQRLASHSGGNNINLLDVATGTNIAYLNGHKDRVHCVAFSPDERYLASGSEDRTIRLWHPKSGAAISCLANRPSQVLAIAFSPDGQTLAAAYRNAMILLFDVSTGAELIEFKGHYREVVCLAFSPDGKRLASGGWLEDKTILIWDTTTGKELQCIMSHKKGCWRLAWAPNGAFLVASLQGNTLHFIDTRPPEIRPPLASAPISVSTPVNTHIPETWSKLPDTWGILHQLGIAAPLSLLLDLQAILAKKNSTTLNTLATHPHLHALQNLNWPESARTGLLALLLNQWPGMQEWGSPNNQVTTNLHTALAKALKHGTPCLPVTPVAPIAWLNKALEQVDDRLLTLLNALGPHAVTADPGLPLRLVSELDKLLHFTQIQRQLLSLRINPIGIGSAQGTGAGQDSTGVSTHGTITAIVQTQWAYPRRLLHWRNINGGLLYRTRDGGEPPQLRPMVILLDTSPACWGVIEALTRPAAHALAETLASQQRRAILLTPDQQINYLNHPAERLQVLLHRSRHAVDIPATLAKAQALRLELTGDGLEPVILLFTHCWFGADFARTTPQPGLRALFVQYPRSEKVPPFGAQCERWETIKLEHWADVAASLGRLSI